jgi:ArsR family transcriptional regulator
MIDAELVPIVSERFKALADPARLLLLSRLFEGECSVGELAQQTGRRQPTVSQQLGRLARAGLVASRREGNRVLYRVSDPYLERICSAVCRSLERDARPTPLSRRRGGRRG